MALTFDVEPGLLDQVVLLPGVSTRTQLAYLEKDVLIVVLKRAA